MRLGIVCTGRVCNEGVAYVGGGTCDRDSCTRQTRDMVHHRREVKAEIDR